MKCCCKCNWCYMMVYILQSESSSTSSSSSSSDEKRSRKNKKSRPQNATQQQQRVKHRSSSASSASSGGDKDDDNDDFMKRLSKRPTKVTQRRTSGRQRSLNRGCCSPVFHVYILSCQQIVLYELNASEITMVTSNVYLYE